MIKAGFSKVCISPPVGAPLAGFAARQGVSQGIHDDLYARALVLSREDTIIALVSVDLLALPVEFVERVRTRIHEQTNIPRAALMIAATHTHAGPVTITTFFNPEESVDAAYMNFLADSIEKCVATAYTRRFPARVGIGVGHVDGVGVNRRSADHRPVDGEIGIIRVDDLDGRTRAVFLNYSCHPTVLGPDNLLVTGDFPNFAIEHIENTLGPDSFAMFANGTQGNISMGHSSELSAIGVITPGRTFERAAELGSLLGTATLEALPAIETSDDQILEALTKGVELPLKSYPPLEVALENLRQADERLTLLNQQEAAEESLGPAKTGRLYASITSFYAREASTLTDGILPIELQGLRIGEAIFVAVPAEVFVEIGLKLKREAPAKTFIVGIANGYIGYLPNREAYAIGGYEVVSAKCADQAEDILIRETIALEERLIAL